MSLHVYGFTYAISIEDKPQVKFGFFQNSHTGFIPYELWDLEYTVGIYQISLQNTVESKRSLLERLDG